MKRFNFNHALGILGDQSIDEMDADTAMEVMSELDNHIEDLGFVDADDVKRCYDLLAERLAIVNSGPEAVCYLVQEKVVLTVVNFSDCPGQRSRGADDLVDCSDDDDDKAAAS